MDRVVRVLFILVLAEQFGHLGLDPFAEGGGSPVVLACLTAAVRRRRRLSAWILHPALTVKLPDVVVGGVLRRRPLPSDGLRLLLLVVVLDVVDLDDCLLYTSDAADE